MEATPTEVTRAVTPTDLADLLRAARVASLAWSEGGQVAAEPVAFDYRHGVYRFGLAPGRFPGDVEATLVVDAGPRYFELRGVRVRGIASRLPAAPQGSLEWFELQPEREIAWHYGRLRARR